MCCVLSGGGTVESLRRTYSNSTHAFSQSSTIPFTAIVHHLLSSGCNLYLQTMIPPILSVHSKVRMYCVLGGAEFFLTSAAASVLQPTQLVVDELAKELPASGLLYG